MRQTREELIPIYTAWLMGVEVEWSLSGTNQYGTYQLPTQRARIPNYILSQVVTGGITSYNAHWRIKGLENERPR